MSKWFAALASVVTLFVTVAGLLLVLAVWVGVNTGRLAMQGENTIGSSSIIGALMALLMSIVGVLVMRSRPWNAVGWSVLAIGFGLGLSQITLAYALIGVSWIANDLPGFKWVAWISQFCWTLTYLGFLLLLLVFPTGRFLSPRWRWVAYMGVAVIGTWTLLTSAMNPYEIGGVQVANPIGGIPQERILPFVNIAFGLFFLMLGAGVVSLVLRYVRTGVAERQQIKWLMYVAAMFLVALAFSFLTRGQVGQILVNLAALAFPIAIGIAILRYRLYDIDIVIRKTLVYSILTVLLALVYFGVVIALQGLFSRLAGVEQSTLAVVISTLVIAALFTPLRRRIQDWIDRRFFRKKYNAQQVLSRFTQIARDETDLDALTAELVHAAQETLQPEGVNVWLRETKSPKRG